MSVNVYGEDFSSEKTAKQNQIAREIVREISNFGVTDNQRWMIIYLLALELENHNELVELTSFIKELKGEQIFVVKEQ